MQGPAGHCICPSVSCDEAVFRSKLHHRCFSMPHYESRSLLVRIHRPSVGEYRSMIPQLARHDGHSEPLPRCHRRAEKKDRPRFKYPHQSKSRIAGCRRALCRLSRSSILVASQPESSVFLCLQLPRHAPHRRHFAPPRVPHQQGSWVRGISLNVLCVAQVGRYEGQKGKYGDPRRFERVCDQVNWWREP